ncbi:septum formation initiator, partial [Pseudonocardia abyssalis]
MSAPVTERSKVRTAPRPARAPKPAVIPAQRGAPAAQRAYAKRDERLRRLVGGVRPARSGPSTRRAQFVLLVMVLLGVGLVTTLWLSTAAAADSYRLQAARDEAGSMTEQVERLRREVAVAASAPELARRASEMGMVPVQDPARLVVGEDGAVTVVGDPLVARA